MFQKRSSIEDITSAVRAAKSRRRFKVDRYQPGRGGMEKSAKRKISELIDDIQQLTRKRRRVERPPSPPPVVEENIEPLQEMQVDEEEEGVRVS